MLNKLIIHLNKLTKKTITYEDLVSNSDTNIGPVFGEIALPISAPIVNDVDSES